MPPSDNWFENNVRLIEAEAYKKAIDLWQSIRRLTTQVEPNRRNHE